MPAACAAEAGVTDPATALAAAQAGGALLFLDVPPGTAFTVDGQAFLSGPAFKGVKMVPPGPHYVTYAARDGESGGCGALGPVSSFWVWVDAASGGGGGGGGAPRPARPPSNSVTVRRWNPATELLDPLGDEEEAGRYAAGVRRFDFDAALAPYALPAWPAWRALAGAVDAAAIARLAPAGVVGGTMSVVAEAGPDGVGGFGAAGSGGGGGGGGRADGGAPRRPTPAEAALESALAAGRAARGAGGGPAAPPPPPPPGVGVPRYTRLPRLVTAAAVAGAAAGAAGAAPGPSSPAAALTAANLDKSAALGATLSAPPFHADAVPGSGLLAELQHAFLSFWAGQCLAGYGAWKAALHLALGCVAAPRSPGLTPFYASLLGTVAAQLEASLGGGVGGGGGSGGRGGGSGGGGGAVAAADPAPGPFGLAMVDELLADSFLRGLFKRFYAGLRADDAGLPPVPPAVRAAADRLAAVVAARLGWQLGGESESEDDDEDGPVVVDEHGNY